MDLFDEIARGGRGRALTFPDRTLSYADLRAHAGRTWRAIAPWPRVAVLAEPRIETAVAIVGALLGGIEAVPLNPRSGTSELAHIRDDARPGAVVAGPGAEIPAALDGLPLVTVDLSERDDDGDATAPPQLGPDAPALIVYTSGTTGPPKGAVLPRRAIASNLDALAQAWAWTADDVVAHALPLFHVHGLVLGILGPLRRGGTAMHLGRFSPEAVADALAGDATMLFGVPTMYRRLAEAAASSPELAAALTRARVLVSGSAALPAAEHARLRRLTGREVIERYGMTETLMNTAMRVGGAVTPGTVGPPLPGIEVRLVDDEGAEIPGTAEPGGPQTTRGGDGEPPIGEVHVRGPNLFLGYLNRPDATTAAMRGGGWFATGDMAVREPDGAIRLVGRRATDLIKSGGYKIGAGEIEAALREHPAVADAAVTGEPDDDLGERVVAWVVLADGARADEPALVDHVAATLAPHKRPRAVRFLAELPRNELGKVQKKRLSAG